MRNFAGNTLSMPRAHARQRGLTKAAFFQTYHTPRFPSDLRIFDAKGKSSKTILPHGGLMVIYHDAIRKKSPKNTNPR